MSGRVPTAARWRVARAAALGLAGVLAIASYHAIGQRYYDDFHVPAGRGMDRLHAADATHLVFFGALGLAALLAIARALVATRVPDVMLAGARRLVASPLLGLALATAVGLSATLAVAHFALRYTAVADDEHVYRFIAQTLRMGALTAPSPGADLEFYAEQFVILDEQVRYGKYLPGHPLLLAVGQVLGIERLVVPLVSALTLFVVFALGKRLFDTGTALLATSLFAVSPQVVFTGATLLSQPASALWATLGVLGLATARGRDLEGRSLLLAGAAFGMGILTRPMPGLLLAAAAGAWVMRTSLEEHRRDLRPVLRVALAPAVALGLVLLINLMREGDPIASGAIVYHTVAGERSMLERIVSLGFAQRAISLVGSVLRLDPWFLGWPAGLLLCLAAAPGSARRLLAWFVVPTLLYRVLVPKLGVGTTGSVYLHESLPLLSLLAAAGLMRAARGHLRCLPNATSRGVAAVLLAGVVVSASMFVPSRLRDVSRDADAQLLLPTLLERHGVRHALVFHTQVVPSWTQAGWAYYPPINSPRLDDDVLFMRLPFGADGLERAVAFWRRRYPERAAWVHLWVPGAPPRLLPMVQYLEGVRRGTLPVAMPIEETKRGSS